MEYSSFITLVRNFQEADDDVDEEEGRRPVQAPFPVATPASSTVPEPMEVDAAPVVENEEEKIDYQPMLNSILRTQGYWNHGRSLQQSKVFG